MPLTGRPGGVLEQAVGDAIPLKSGERRVPLRFKLLDEHPAFEAHHQLFAFRGRHAVDGLEGLRDERECLIAFAEVRTGGLLRSSDQIGNSDV